MVESNWLEHIPFYFWLIEAQNPELIFEPELQSGVTYFALCQAVDKLNTDTRCIASFSNDCKEIERITQYNNDHYQEFSLLSPEAGTLSIEDIDEGELDLLILKYNSEMIFDKKTMDIWQKKLSTRSIVLIHGSQKKEIKPLCRKLKEEYQTFEFNHGQGLLIVFTGSAQTTKMQALISLKGNTSGIRVMQDVYSRLGQAWRETWLNVNSRDKIKELEKQILSNREELTIIEQEKSSINSKLKEVSTERKAISATNQTLQSSVELRFNELATLTKLFQQAENELQTVKVELESLKDKNNKLKESYSVERVTLEKEVKSLAKQLNDKQFEKDNVLSELDDVRKVVQEQQSQISRLKQNNELLEKDQEQAARSIETLTQENRKLEQSLQQRFDELAVLTGMLDEKTMQTQVGKAKGAAEATKISKVQKNFSLKKLVKKSSAKEKMKRNIALIRNSGLFDENWYIKTYPAAANNKNGVIAHYLEQGAKEGCNPSPLFSHNGYLNTYPDVKDAGANPLLHYIKFGKGEGRYIERV